MDNNVFLARLIEHIRSPSPTKHAVDTECILGLVFSNLPHFYCQTNQKIATLLIWLTLKQIIWVLTLPKLLGIVSQGK